MLSVIQFQHNSTRTRRCHVNALATFISRFNTLRFFLVGICKGTVFVPPVPANLHELRDRITAAVALIYHDMLTRVWNELDYRLDVCRISQGGHIEHLCCKKKLVKFLVLLE